MKRTHNCGQLRKADVGQTVTLAGWVDRRRDHGGVIFVDLRDKYGKTQIVFNPDYNADVMKTAEQLRNEYVITVTGKVYAREEGNTNEKLATGEIEIKIDQIEILNAALTSPLAINDPNEECKENDDLRLQYRYLDLRRPWIQKKLLLKSRFLKAVYDFFYANGFENIETPVLCKSTPEGARDYLVPSRVNPGKFYALPQSPQQYKQLLMIAGMDRYFQIAKCFRDEDLRADRQPEFTQIDVEMSFVDQDDVMAMFDKFVTEVLGKVWDFEPPKKIRRMKWHEAMLKYGSDKPDLRFDLEIHDVSEIGAKSEFGVFKNCVAAGGKIRGIAAKRTHRLRGQVRFQGPRVDARQGKRRSGNAGRQVLHDGTAQRTARRCRRQVRRHDVLHRRSGKGCCYGYGPAPPGSRPHQGSPRPEEARIRVDYRIPDVRIQRHRRPLHGHAPPVHQPAPGTPGHDARWQPQGLQRRSL